ncbi:hypothetical protein NQ176_g1757 [Zarea fungicola]|uniref:Uncharacterized protein n=1 Tax=Zarea fungicola TaxID=93591 RepID=A0ACC1NRB8_9HYPO|nr:hypothetical protein NQ176_g1757 [Lecanicillium fungicola]
MSPSGDLPVIDEFLGYSEDLLHVLKFVNQLSQSGDLLSTNALAESDLLLGKVKAMVTRDNIVAPGISTSLAPECHREFLLTHKTFQQATLIHIYRRLYRLPSRSEPIQCAVRSIYAYVSEMIQGELCHTWVAMAMPIFAVGCEAFTEEQKQFVLDKLDKFDCLGSLHVDTLRHILLEMWKLRESLGDTDGNLCAGCLLGKSKTPTLPFTN